MKTMSLGEFFSEKSNNLNLIRLLAAFAVIYGHASAITGKGPQDLFLQWVGYKFIGGVAVDVFFVISGYLITQSSMSKQGLAYYCASRVLRIYPALIVCICISVFVLGLMLTKDSGYLTSAQTWRYLWVNASAFNTEYFLPGVFEQLHDKAVNGSLWSLAVEVRLYVIVLLLAVLGVFRSRALFNALFFSGLIIGYLNPGFWAFILPHENHLHVSMMFMIGSFYYMNRESISINAGILLGLLFFAAAQHGTPTFGVSYALLLPYLVFYVAFAPGARWFNNFGDYSYGVYLYGWISQQLVVMYLPDSTNLLLTVLSSILAFGFAFLSWHLVEKRAMNCRVYFRRVIAKEGIKV